MRKDRGFLVLSSHNLLWTWVVFLPFTSEICPLLNTVLHSFLLDTGSAWFQSSASALTQLNPLHLLSKIKSQSVTCCEFWNVNVKGGGVVSIMTKPHGLVSQVLLFVRSLTWELFASLKSSITQSQEWIRLSYYRFFSSLLYSLEWQSYFCAMSSSQSLHRVTLMAWWV